MNYVLSRETVYFIGIVVVGGVLWAVGQSWAIGLVGVGSAGAAAFGVSGLLKHRRLPLSK
jgi:hypothetical protein